MPPVSSLAPVAVNNKRSGELRLQTEIREGAGKRNTCKSPKLILQAKTHQSRRDMANVQPNIWKEKEKSKVYNVCVYTEHYKQIISKTLLRNYYFLLSVLPESTHRLIICFLILSHNMQHFGLIKLSHKKTERIYLKLSVCANRSTLTWIKSSWEEQSSFRYQRQSPVLAIIK